MGEALLAAGGGTEELLNILARAFVNASIIFRMSGQSEDALRASMRARALAEQATSNDPDDRTAAWTRLQVAVLASHLLHKKGQADEARQLCEHDIAFGNARVREHPRDVETRMWLASLEINLGDLEKNEGRPHQALKIILNAAESLGTLARENPLLIRVRSQWANSLFNLSNLQTDLGRYVEGEQSARAAIDVDEARPGGPVEPLFPAAFRSRLRVPR